MKNKVLFILLIILNIFVYSENIVLNIDKAVEIAIKQNLNLQNEEISLKVKKRFKNYSPINSFLPSVGFSTGISRPNERTRAESGEYTTPQNILSYKFDATLPISLALFDGVKYTVLDYEAGIITFEKAKKQLERDVKKSFNHILLLEKRTDLIEQNLKTAKKRYDQSTINFNAGTISEYTLLSAQVSYENIKPIFEDLKNTRETAIMSFKLLLGYHRKDVIRLSGVIEPEKIKFDSDLLINKNLNNRLDINGLLKAIEISKNAYKGFKNDYLLPSLYLNYVYDPILSTDPLTDLSGEWNQQQGAFTIGVQMSLDNFIPGSKKDVELKKYKDTIKKTENSLAYALQAAEIEIESIIMNLKKSLKSIKTLELNVKLAQKAYDLAEEAYNVGSREILEVENAEDELHEAKINLLIEKHNYVTNIWDLEYSLNSSFAEIKKQLEESNSKIEVN